MVTKGKTKPTAEALAKEKAETLVKTDVDGVKRYKCQYCGKWIKAESFEEFMAGDYCHDLRENRGFDEAALAELRAGMSAEEVPVTKDGRDWIKVAVLDKRLKRLGIPISRMVKAFGKDRSVDGPMHPKFQVVYVGRARYLHPDCGEEWGLNYLREMQGGRNSNPAPNSNEQKEVEEALS